MEIKEYNQKGFLLPDSINSCASFHAKVLPSGEYMFRVHDCINGVRLRGDLKDKKQVKEAIEKLRNLSEAAKHFAEFIQQEYIVESNY